MNDSLNTEQKYVVRLWDGFDGPWMDVSEPVSEDEAKAIWNEKTDGGTKSTSYADIDYYKVFEADTTMVFSYESGLSQRGEVLPKEQ